MRDLAAVLAFVRAREPFVSFTYDDYYDPQPPARFAVPVMGVLTIGRGETGWRAHFGARCTEAEADAWLAARIERAAAIVERDIGAAGIAKSDLPDNRFTVLVDFVIAAGLEIFENNPALLQGVYADYPGDFFKMAVQWDALCGDLPGCRRIRNLEARREAERKLWNGDVIEDKPKPETPPARKPRK
jgi:GH24 family phage-related lysozyme (muramidase)